MQAAIHPELLADATTICSNCGAVFQIASTVSEQSVETCRMCHPIYTGKKQTELKGGRVERFKKRMEGKK